MSEGTLLQNLGLSEIEARIYLAALEYGKSLPKHLAERAHVKRPTLYKVLPGLFDKGLISETIIGKRRYLIAEDPEVYIEKKKSELGRLESLLPELRSLLNTASSKPVINFYHGIEGLKRVYLDSLRIKKPILEFLGLEEIHPEIQAYTTSYYIPERIRRKIPIKIIVSGPARYGKFNLVTNSRASRDVKQIDEKQFPMPLDGYVYGDNVSFIVYRVDSEPVGVIIRSREISTSLRSLFELVWSQIK